MIIKIMLVVISWIGKNLLNSVQVAVNALTFTKVLDFNLQTKHSILYWILGVNVDDKWIAIIEFSLIIRQFKRIQSHTDTNNFFKKMFEIEREESMLMLQFRSFKFYI